MIVVNLLSGHERLIRTAIRNMYFDCTREEIKKELSIRVNLPGREFDCRVLRELLEGAD